MRHHHHHPHHHLHPYDRHLPVTHLGAALSQAVVPFMAGLVLGGALLAYLRFRRLRWTWVLLLAPFAYLSFPIDWRAGLALSVGLVAAVAGGVRLDLEARHKGGEEARAAREHIGPLAGLRILIAERRGRKAQPKDDAFPLGRSRDGRIAWVPLGRIGHGVHALLVGVTGGGKTVTMMRIIQAHVLAGIGAVVVDPKGDRRLRAMLRALAAALGVRFREWSPSGPAVYNPLAAGNPDEIADKALSAHEWSEPHYEMATRRLLGLALATMRAAGEWPPTLPGLVANMDPDRLDALADRVGGELGASVRAYVDGLGSQGRADLRGGRDRLAILCESGLGRWLDPSRGGEEIDLAAVCERGEIVYFSLESDRYPAASKLLASALVIDLAGLVGSRQGSGRAGLLALDEFGALAGEHVARLAARARSAGISLLLGAQSLADLRLARPGDPTSKRAKKSEKRRAHGTGHVFVRNGAVHVKFRPVPGKPPVQRKICRVGELSDTAIERKRASIEAKYKPPAEDGEIPTVKQTANRYIAKLKDEDKATSYVKGREGAIRTHLEDTTLGDLAVDRVKPADIRKHYGRMRKRGAKGSVLVSVHWLLSGTFKVAMEDEHRTDNPVAAVATPRYSAEDEIRPLTTEEVDRVIAAVPDDDLGRVERDLYRVAQHTGMRRGELLALRWMDCQFELDSFDISQNFVEGETKDTKGHLSRTTPMTRTAKEVLLVRRKTCRFSDDEDLVFTLTGDPLDPGKVSKRFKAALLRAEVGPVEMRYYKTSRGRGKWKPFPKLKLHQLRDTFASHNMSNPTVAPVEVQNALGHKDLSTTSRRYGKYIPQADTAERFEASFNRPSVDTQNPRQGTEKVAEEGTVHA